MIAYEWFLSVLFVIAIYIYIVHTCHGFISSMHFKIVQFSCMNKSWLMLITLTHVVKIPMIIYTAVKYNVVLH